MVKTIMCKNKLLTNHFNYKRTYYLSGFKNINALFIEYTWHGFFFLIHVNPPFNNDCSFPVLSILKGFKLTNMTNSFSSIYPTFS